jgi:succinate dehydrogenase / fumarate reductase iron-sulfur subunit
MELLRTIVFDAFWSAIPAVGFAMIFAVPPRMLKYCAAGGFVSVNTSGNTLDANAIPVPKEDADKAMDAAACIGCGACVATCKNGSAMLFVGAKVSQFALLPQGRVEAKRRVLNMVKQMDEEGFGNCSNTGACEVECPKGISLENIARMNREFLAAQFTTVD